MPSKHLIPVLIFQGDERFFTPPYFPIFLTDGAAALNLLLCLAMP